jgi:antibiotic biosynthesis monooxygenase (ABM) superfamily enzyme
MATNSSTVSAEVPTVIVSRRVVPGAEDAYRSWALRIRDAAQGFPGYLGADVQPPDQNHPAEWVTVYSFASGDQLEAWLTSSIRRRLLEEGKALLASEAREQRVAGLRLAPEPVTVVFSQRVKPGRESEFHDLVGDITPVLRSFDGFLDVDLVEPVDGVQAEHAVVVGFASRRQLDVWLESSQRREWLDRIAPLIEGERSMSVVGGFGGWFEGSAERPGGPPRWKQAVAVLIALYPTALTIGWAMNLVAPDLPFALGMLISNILGVAGLTWLLMPLVTRLLAGWLGR